MLSAVGAAKSTLNKLQTHSQEGHEPHPEDGTRSTELDCDRNTGNIADACSAREGGGKSLECGYSLP
jgi:hypothetical protein